MAEQQTKKNLLVTLANPAYLNAAKQLFASVYLNAGWTGDYLLLAQDLDPRDLNWFRSRGILVYVCQAITSSTFALAGQNDCTYSKFHLFKEDFKQWQTVIFLDADIIVRSSLDSLIYPDGLSVAGHYRLSEQFKSARTLAPKDKISFQQLAKAYSLQASTFNAGVMVFNSDLIKAGDFEKLLKLLDQYKNIQLRQDQTILNLFFYQNFNTLPDYYNSWPDYLIKVLKIKPQDIEAPILHFMSNHKPWLSTSPFYQEWLANLKQAEQIDFTTHKPGKVFTPKAMASYEARLIDKPLRYLFNNLCLEIEIRGHRLLGQWGQSLRRWRGFLELNNN